MPILMILLVIGVFAYLYHRRVTTTLTRNCRWRQMRSAGAWRCAYCGAQVHQGDAPRDCLRGQSG